MKRVIYFYGVALGMVCILLYTSTCLDALPNNGSDLAKIEKMSADELYEYGSKQQIEFLGRLEQMSDTEIEANKEYLAKEAERIKFLILEAARKGSERAKRDQVYIYRNESEKR
jgi:hypothetical protein